MKNKLKNQKGLTLVEMLCVVVAVIIMSALLTTGIALAANTLSESVTASEASILCDTVSTKLCYCIKRDGFNADSLGLVDSSGAEVLPGQCGEVTWNDCRILPSKTYPAGAAVKFSVAPDEEAEADKNAVVVTLVVCNRRTGNEYCHKDIHVNVFSVNA